MRGGSIIRQLEIIPSKSQDVVCPSPRGMAWKLIGDQSGHLTKTVVTGVTEHEGPTYYHHAHVYDGSYEDGTASCRAKNCVPEPSISGWWLGISFIFPYIGNLIIPIDIHIFQRG